MGFRSTSAKEEILGRIRNANKLAGVPSEPYPIPRDYRTNRTRSTDELVDLLEDRLVDYKADVHIVKEADLPSTVADLCREHRFSTVGVAEGIDESIYSSVSADVEMIAPLILISWGASMRLSRSLTSVPRRRARSTWMGRRRMADVR